MVLEDGLEHYLHAFIESLFTRKFVFSVKRMKLRNPFIVVFFVLFNVAECVFLPQQSNLCVYKTSPYIFYQCDHKLIELHEYKELQWFINNSEVKALHGHSH